MFDFTMPTDALRAYAASRDLAYEETGLLPPIASVLRYGLGVGEKRASVITSQSDRGYSARGGLRKHPERATWNLCQGVLPGGVQGALGHHQHLEQRSDSDGGNSWYVDTDTVVVARLPERARALCELSVTPGATGGTTALATLDLSGGRAPIAIHAIGRTVQQRGGRTFDINPAEDAATLDAIASADTLTALSHAPADTRVEMTDGVVCVWARGIVEDAGALDAMCAVLMCIARGVRETVARHGDLDPRALLPAPAATARQQWLDSNVARVDWSVPAASVADARAAYEPLLNQRAKGSGRRAMGAIGIIGIVALLVWFAGSYFAFKYLFEDELYGIGFAVVTTLYGLWKLIRAVFESGEEIRADEVVSQAGPWGLEAFARGYARARGLTVEDPDVFRHRLTAPIPGRPLRVMGGDLGEGVHGHVALWHDWAAKQHWLVAAVPAGTGDAAPGYESFRHGDVLVLGRRVAETERSAAELDALIAQARRLAAHSIAA